MGRNGAKRKHLSLPAKIIRPASSGLIPRKRLFSLLESNREKPVIWITGPPGAGKTSLAASYIEICNLPCLWYRVDEGDSDLASFFYYIGLAAKNFVGKKQPPLPLLTPEYLDSISVFTKRYFENLFSALKTTQVIVLDNYQDVPDNSSFHGMLVHGLQTVPEGINVLVLSRNAPPPVMARFRANNKLAVIGWDDLRFTAEETWDFVISRNRNEISQDFLVGLHAKTKGWVAGMILMLENKREKDFDDFAMGGSTPAEIFDYFASEVFDKTDRETQEFLIKTVFLTTITPSLARRLTGQEKAAEILSALNRNHYFTELRPQSEPVYQFHPLFKEFLLSTAATLFSSEELNVMRMRSAALLEEAGRPEEAIVLFLDSEQWENAVRLILMHAHKFTAPGMIATVSGWLRRLPEEVIKGNPFLLFWQGLCLMPFTPDLSRKSFETAFRLSEDLNDRLGLCLSWSGFVEAALHEGNLVQLDRWISSIKRVFPDGLAPLSIEIEARMTISIFNALSLRQPHHPEMAEWKDKVLSLLHFHKGLDKSARVMAGCILVVHDLYMGNIAEATNVLDVITAIAEGGEISDLSTIALKNTEGLYSFFLGSCESCIRKTREGLELAEDTGVHMWDGHIIGHGVSAALSSGDMQTADRLLAKFRERLDEGRLFDRMYYHAVRAWRYLSDGDLVHALKDMELAVRMFEASGSTFNLPIVYAAMAEILYEKGDKKAAHTFIEKTRDAAIMRKSSLMKYVYLLFKARACLDEGDDDKAVDLLKDAMSLGREKGIVNYFCSRGSVMARLCMKALEAGIDVEYVRSLIRKRNIHPAGAQLHVETWPFPLRVNTLGGFEIVKDDRLVIFSGKVPKRTFEMLKALIAFGGRDVPEELISDALWPETEGDLAARSFDTTLHRLRHLMGYEKAVTIREGRLGLDARYCRVDLQAFMSLTEKIGESLKIKGSEEQRKRGDWAESKDAGIIELAEKAVRLYKGHFLPSDTARPWTTSVRERLRSKFHSLILWLGNEAMKNCAYEKALEYFQKGLDVDSLNEEFYQHLMVCHQHLGQRSKAVEAYHQCRAVLASTYGLKPSRKTDDIYSNITDGRQAEL